MIQTAQYYDMATLSKAKAREFIDKWTVFVRQQIVDAYRVRRIVWESL